LADIAFEVIENFIEAAATIESTVKQTELFTRAKPALIAQQALVLNAAFSDPVLLEDVNSDVIEITPDHLMVIRKKAHNPSEIKLLTAVSDDISQRLKMQKSQELAQDKAQQYLTAWNNGEKIADVAVSEKVGVLRTNRDIDPAIINAAFKLAKSDQANELVSTAAGEAIVTLTKVTEATEVGDSVATIIQRMERSNADVTYRAFIQSLKDASDIQYPKA